MAIFGMMLAHRFSTLDKDASHDGSPGNFLVILFGRVALHQQKAELTGLKC